MELWHDFMTHEGSLIYKWRNYFPIYQRHFSHWVGKSLTVLEIGVAEGGSAGMWQRYFGPLAHIVGIDINPKCKSAESMGISVRIGNQSDTVFLQKVCDEFGEFDIVIDDGSHLPQDMKASFNFLYPKVSKNGCYLIEDLHAELWGVGKDHPDTFTTFAKSLVENLGSDNDHFSYMTPSAFAHDTFCISFYDSIIAFDKAKLLKNVDMRRGK